MHRPEKGDYPDVRVDGADGPHDLGTALEYLVVVCLDRPGVEVVNALGVPQVRGIVGLVVEQETHHAGAFAVLGGHLPVVHDGVELRIEPVRHLQARYAGVEVDEKEILHIQIHISRPHELNAGIEIHEAVEIFPEQTANCLGAEAVLFGNRVDRNAVDDWHDSFHLTHIVEEHAGSGSAAEGDDFLAGVSGLTPSRNREHQDQAQDQQRADAAQGAIPVDESVHSDGPFWWL